MDVLVQQLITDTSIIAHLHREATRHNDGSVSAWQYAASRRVLCVSASVKGRIYHIREC